MRMFLTGFIACVSKMPRQTPLLHRLSVYAWGGFRCDLMKPQILRKMAVLLGQQGRIAEFLSANRGLGHQARQGHGENDRTPAVICRTCRPL